MFTSVLRLCISHYENSQGWTMHMKCSKCGLSLFSCSVVSDSVQPHGLWPARLLCPWDSPGKNIGVGCQSLLQGIFLAQGLSLGLLHCRWILYHLSHQGSPRILEWVAYPFFRGSSWPKNWTGVSCIAGRFFTYQGATRETQNSS